MTEDDLEIEITTQEVLESALLAITKDEGEIVVSDNEERILDLNANFEENNIEDSASDDLKNRKRKHDKVEENNEKEARIVNSTNDNIDDEPKTKKAALDRLRNMKFAVKDPFKDNPLKERPTFIRSTKQNSQKSPINDEEPATKSSSRRSSRDHLDDDSSYRSRRNRRSRSRNGNNERHRAENSSSSSMDKIIESRHQRSTMYFLQKDKSKYGISSSSSQQQKQPTNRSNLPTKPIQERIEAFLARPDYEVLAMPVADLRALILQGAELFREQNNFLNAKKTLLSELDSIIFSEREEIGRLSQEIPLTEQNIQETSQQKVLDFSVPPPNILPTSTSISGTGGLSSGGVNNEFSTPPNYSLPPPSQQVLSSSTSTSLSSLLNLNYNPSSQTTTTTTTLLSSSSSSINQQLIIGGGGGSSSPFSHFSQTPSLLYPSTPSKLIQQQLNVSVSSSSGDVSSTTTEIVKPSISLPNTSFPPPNLLETSRPHSNPNISINRPTANLQLPPPSLTSFFTVPPPQIIKKQPELVQQQPPVVSAIPSLLSLPPPQIVTNTSQFIFSSATASPLKQPLLEQQKQAVILTSTATIPSLLSLPTQQLIFTAGNVSSSTVTPPRQQDPH